MKIRCGNGGGQTGYGFHTWRTIFPKNYFPQITQIVVLRCVGSFYIRETIVVMPHMVDKYNTNGRNQC